MHGAAEYLLTANSQVATACHTVRMRTLRSPPTYRGGRMDADEYRRMAEAGNRHWWYQATRELLEALAGLSAIAIGRVPA